MKHLVRICTKILEAFTGLTLLALTAMVFVNVVLRYFFNSGITVTEELGRFLFVWVVFAGAVLAAGSDSHVKVDFLIEKLPPALHKAALVLGDAVMLFICILIVDGGWKQAAVNMDNESPITKLPLGWLYIAGMLAGLFIALILAVRLVGRLAAKNGGAVEAKGARS